MILNLILDLIKFKNKDGKLSESSSIQSIDVHCPQPSLGYVNLKWDTDTGNFIIKQFHKNFLNIFNLIINLKICFDYNIV